MGFVGFMNAYLLTGDDRYLDLWRADRQRSTRKQKTIDGRTTYPTMYGDDGWYHFTPENYSQRAGTVLPVAAPEDRKACSGQRLAGLSLPATIPSYPEQPARPISRGFVNGRRNASETTTPDTRLADDPMKFNPASVSVADALMLGGLIRGNERVAPLHCRLRYFDPSGSVPALPKIWRLDRKMTDDSVTVALVNVNQLDRRTLVVQGGAYAEHQTCRRLSMMRHVDVMTVVPGAHCRRQRRVWI